VDLTDEDWEAIRKAGGIRYASLVRIEGARLGGDGVERSFVLEIEDFGPDEKDKRFEARVCDERGRSVAGRPSTTAGAALATIRWNELDREV
jgi:hypothetical protein